MAEPIFIHSLFRAGSTYVFEAFRRAPGFWCYQEPLNETLLRQDEHAAIFQEDPGALAARLRHPGLTRPYYAEFAVAAAAVRDLLKKELIYDSFFSAGGAEGEALAAYFAALAEKAQGRPVFQECRTFGRAPGLAAALGGIHIYLWRNPWDQWWSNKVHPYFDLVYQLVLNADGAPGLVTRLRDALGFQPCRDPSLDREIDHFWARLPSAEHSYLVFYCLWAYALHLNASMAHCTINLDSLARSPDYRASTLAALDALGIRGLDFSDCSAPQGNYAPAEQAFFAAIEQRAEDLLAAAGLDGAVAEARRQRAAHHPMPSPATLPGELARFRELTLSLHEEIASLHRNRERLDAEVRRVAQVLADHKNALDAIQHSWAWRAAAPLRLIERLLARLARSRGG